MSDLVIGPDLVGRTVTNVARPEWGPGQVLRVQLVSHAGQPTHRVSVQFAVGHRTLLVPPARLAAPTPEPQRTAGWLDTLGRRTSDDTLRALPPAAVDVLGSPRTRLAAALKLYEYEDTAAGRVHWARRQTGVADPLSHWNRDELEAAFAVFARERDAHCRMLAALVRQSEGPRALPAILAALAAAPRARVLEALRRVI